MFDKPPPITDLELARYLAGELPPAEAARLRRALQRDPEATARLSALRAAAEDDGATDEADPGPPAPTAEDFARAADDLAGPVVPGTWRRAVGVMIVAGAAVSLVAVIPGGSSVPGGTPGAEPGLPGAVAGLSLLHGRDGRRSEAPPRVRVQAGDVLQPVLSARVGRQVALLVDHGEGAVPWLHEGGRTVTVPPGEEVALRGALTVGDRPPRAIHGFVCEAPVAVEALAARVDGGPPVAGCRQAGWALQP